MTSNKTIIITLPASTKKQLQIIAIQQDTNMNAIINQLILDYIAEHQNISENI